MDSILPFQSREPIDPHSAGKAHCLACQHKWTAVVPVGTVWLTCPACGTNKGLLIYACQLDEKHWTCDCDNQLFMITKAGIYCPNCGSSQHGF